MAALEAAAAAAEIKDHWHEKLRGVVEDFKATGGIIEQDGTLLVDSKEVGTLIRSVGIYPSEQQVTNLSTEMGVDEQTGTVKYESFYNVLQRIVKDPLYKRDNEEKLYRAFLAMDKERKGYLTRDELRRFMTAEGGEPLKPEELEEMLAAATDPKHGKIFYEEYIYNLALDAE